MIHGNHRLIVHFLYGDTSLGLIPYLKKILPIDIIATIHSCPSDLPEVVQKPNLLSSVDEFILLGSNQKPFFYKHGIQDEKLNVIPHGVDTQFYHPAKSVKPNSKLKLLTVGNWRRNFRWYRELAAALNRKEIDFQFTIIADEAYHTALKGIANIHLKSGIDDMELLDLYQKSDVLVMGVEDAVANNVVLEAMACGLPIISESVGAVAEYLGGTGMLVNPGDTRSAINWLEKIHRNSDLKDKISRSLRKRAQLFQWHHIAEQTAKRYRHMGWGASS